MSVSNIFLNTNNPANIRFVKSNNWKGQVGNYKGFASFSHVHYGLRALILLIKNYIRDGYDTTEAIIYRFAPPSENDTENYLKFINNYIGYTFESYDPYDIYLLLKGICLFETGYVLDYNVFVYVCKKFRISF